MPLSSQLPRRAYSGVLPTGRYLIQTSDQRVLVAFADGNRGTHLTTTDDPDENALFDIVKLTTNNSSTYTESAKDEEYNIINFVWANFATPTQTNTAVEGRADQEFQWFIHETSVSGNYWIYFRRTVLDPKVYWSLDNRNPGTTVKLTTKLSNAQVWRFVREFH